MALCTVTLILASLGATEWRTGVEYRLEGQLVAVKSQSTDSAKRFQVSLFTDRSGQMVYWTLTENGRGQAPWLERFGAWDTKDPNASESGPALYYQRDDGLSITDLPPALVSAPVPWKVGARWKHQKREFEVFGQMKIDERACWQVRASDPVGRVRRMAVEKTTGIVLQLDENLFLGQGERYELKWRISPRANAANRVAQAADVTRRLVALREGIGYRRRAELTELTSAQREQLAKALSPLVQSGMGTPIEAVVNVAKRDVMTQERRADSVASIRKRALGRDLSKNELRAVEGEPVHIANGKVTVLHFWKYRDKPLKEPYGQAAYVDFLFRRRMADEVAVYGVNVDSRLGAPATRAVAVRSAKKFRAFMNLSYPLLLDDGALLKVIGDPRSVGASLPLYVVLDRTGKVVDYKAGLYEVDRRDGLKALDESVTKALGERRAENE